jgi:hypothetical protein
MIIVEDGTIVENANSLVTRAEYIAYAASVGVTVSSNATADFELIKSMQFINSKERQLTGTRVERDQSVAYPRYSLTIDGFAYDEFEIPRVAKKCQMEIALDIRAGVDPYNPPANPNRATKREKVDVVEVEYMGGDKNANPTRQTQWAALLAQLMKYEGAGLRMTRAL